jgi:regulation of enolase protein 1 (concanavalin A-like superfamily)
MRRFSCVLIVALTLTFAPWAAAEEKWQTVTSKEGKFTVEMPGKPTIKKTRTRKGSKIKVSVLGCTTEAGSYFAYKVDLTTAVVPGAEEAELDAQRDALAEEWNGEVLSEKHIRAADKVGRDFTIRGKPKEGPGELKIRVRQYLVGKAIYIVSVVSPPDHDLPVDTGRFLGSLELGETRTRAAGTPGPEPKGTEVAGWGLAIDPDNDCKIRGEKDRLTIEVPGSRHDLHPEGGKLNAPRVLRAVEGDFIVTVKVVGEFRPGGKSTNPRGIPFNGAGILVWSDPDNYIRLERAAVLRPGNRVGTYVSFEEREGGAPGASHNEVSKGGDCFVRVQRRGSRIFGFISFDGVNWNQLQPINTVWPAKLKVGLAAVNSNNQPFTVTFEEFKLESKAR